MTAEHEIVIKVKRGLLRRPVGIRFDMLAFFRMLESFGINLGDDVTAISKVPYDEMLCVAIAAGYESYCFKHKQVMKYDRDLILKWIDDSVITRGHMKILGNLWNDFMKDYTAVTDKKKVTAKE